MRAPLALGILTWDEALAGFSASGVCAGVLCLDSVPVFYLGERQNAVSKTFSKCTAG